MLEEELRKEQLKDAMDLVERGIDPDHIMIFSPEEYAKAVPRGYAYTLEKPFDLSTGIVYDFPITQIGSKEVLEPVDMGIYSFQMPYTHPVKTYLEATLTVLKSSTIRDITDSQLNAQKEIYATLYKVICDVLVYYEEDLKTEKVAAAKPDLNYLDKMEYDRDVRNCERVISSLEVMRDKTQEGINIVKSMLASAKGTRC